MSFAFSFQPRFFMNGWKSSGLNTLVFFGSRLTLAMSARSCDVWFQLSETLPSAIHRSSRSVKGPGFRQRMPASSQTSFQTS